MEAVKQGQQPNLFDNWADSWKAAPPYTKTVPSQSRFKSILRVNQHDQ